MKTKLYKRLFTFASLAFVLFFVNACGYTLQGTTVGTRDSVLGSGEKTIAITKIEQSSLIPWIPFVLRTELHTEMNMRRLAVWSDIDEADYTMEVDISSFETRAFITGDDDKTLLSVVSAQLTVVVFDKKHNVVWNSGPITYSENYENVREDEAIRDILREIVYILYDRMQSVF